MAYKHRDVVIAWMDGAVIEQQLDDGRWYRLGPCTSKIQHAFCEDKCYRIKPKPVMIRHYTYKGSPTHPCLAVRGWTQRGDSLVVDLERKTDLIWLDEWHEASFSAPEN